MDIEGLHRRVQNFAAQHLPSLASSRVLVAVSGGGDSVATAALLRETGIIDPALSAVAHFDHRLRGPNSARAERRAVEALCARYELDLVAGSWDEPRPGESAARGARYGFLRDAAARVQATVVVTGHTSDDQAETVLMHTMRGAGLHGLRGMQPQNIVDGITIARPMLSVSRTETRAYCAALGLAFVDDKSNSDTRILRNKVRLELLPAMEASFPGARDALLRSASEAADAVRALEALAATVFEDASAECVAMTKQRLRALPEAVLPYALRLAVERLTRDARELDRRHYAILARALAARTGAVFELPRGLKIFVDAEELVVTRGLSATIPPGFVAPVPFSGQVGAWDITVVPVRGSGLALPEGAVVRGRKPGDRMTLLGGRRKLQDVLVDRKVPRRLRDAMPVIACASEVFWTPLVTAQPSDQGLPHEVTANGSSFRRT